MNLDLKGKNALVCGSSRGIGKATAIELALLGANVTLLSRTEETLLKAKSELDTSKGQAHAIQVADLGDFEDYKTRVKALCTDREFHILVNNTGGPPSGAVESAEADAFLAAFQQHLLANQFLMQCVLPSMKKAGFGRIVNIVSTSVREPINNLGVSNTIRGAVGNWSKTLANEIGKYGITVNNVLPGYTNTGRLAEIIDARSKNGKSSEEVIKGMQANVPAGRFAEPSEIASAVAFLASPAAGYINGTNITVDGGRTKSF